MGSTSSISSKEIITQERFVRRNLNNFNNQLGKKYSNDQIECKLRQMYNNTDMAKKDTFISEKDWTFAKKMTKK